MTEATVLEDLESAAQGHNGLCKVCGFLDTLVPVNEDIKVDALIRAKVNGRNKISEDRVSSILKAHGAVIGATTIRRHRTNCAPRSADAQS